MSQYVVFHPYGTVDLEASHASDLSVVNAARVSFAKHSRFYSDTDARVLRFLMKEKHGTPFEHNYFRWRVRAPMIVFWEWVRHRMASYNVESARYVEMRPHFYYPDEARIQKGRPGDYWFESGTGEQTKWLQKELSEHSQQGFDLYLEAIDRGIAKEQARLFVPPNLYVEFYFSCNARSLMNFLSLRNDTHAMFEIRKYAIALEYLWGEVMPDTKKAFVEHGRIAP